MTVTCYAVDLDEYNKWSVLCTREASASGVQTVDGKDSVMTITTCKVAD